VIVRLMKEQTARVAKLPKEVEAQLKLILELKSYDQKKVIEQKCVLPGISKIPWGWIKDSKTMPEALEESQYYW
jgi:hypothetical protein